MLRVAADRRLDPADLRGHLAEDEREVRLLDPAGLQLGHQRVLGGVGPGDHQQAARVAVEAMDDPGPLDASSARKPVSRLTTPPGRSDVAIASASSIAASGRVSDATTTTVLPPTIAGAIRETRPEQRRLLGREDGDDAGRLGHREVEVRPGDGIGAAEHLRQLVGPAGVPDDPVDRALDLARGRSRLAPRSARARLHHLGERGTAPGRGCTPSRPPSSGTRRAPP